MDNKTDIKQTINNINNYYLDFKAKYDISYDKYNQEKIKAVKSLLKDLNSAIKLSIQTLNKLDDTSLSIKKRDELINTTFDKSIEAIDYTKARILEALKGQSYRKDTKITKNIDKLKNSKQFSNAKKLAKDINDKIDNSKVKESINKITLSSLNLAEKGADKVIEFLNKDK